MQLINQFSFPLLAIVGAVILVVGLLRVPKLNRYARITLLGIYLLGIFFVSTQFRYPDSPVTIDTVVDVEAILQNSASTFVMLYSNY